MKEIYIRNIAQRLEVFDWQVQNCIDLFDEGGTIPFISRYRKERTGGLDDLSVCGGQDGRIELQHLAIIGHEAIDFDLDVGRLRVDAAAQSRFRQIFKALHQPEIGFLKTFARLGVVDSAVAPDARVVLPEMSVDRMPEAAELAQEADAAVVDLEHRRPAVEMHVNRV